VGFVPGLAQSVGDGEQPIAVAREQASPLVVALALSGLPAAAVYRDHYRVLVASCGQNHVAEELDAVVVGVGYGTFDHAVQDRLLRLSDPHELVDALVDGESRVDVAARIDSHAMHVARFEAR